MAKSLRPRKQKRNRKQILKKITKYDGLEETYYASLTKRLHRLKETGYVREAKHEKEGIKGQARYDLRMRTYLAMFLKEYSMPEILDKATDTQAARILLALLDSVLERENSSAPI